MKKLIASVLAIIMALTLVACANTGTETTAPSGPSQTSASTGTTASSETTEPKEPVEIEFITWWAAEAGGEYYEAFIDEFEAEYPWITVNMITLPFGSTRNQVIASKATNTVPDVIAMNPPWAREFYDIGILAPLDELMAADENFNKDDYYQASFTKIEGNTYLAPVSAMAFYLFYNKTLFNEADLEAPKNWDEIVSHSKALTNPAKNQYGITLSMSEQEASNGSILSLYPLLYALNGRTFVDGKYTVQTDEMLTSMKLLDQLRKDGSILPGTTTKSEVQKIEEFTVGNIGMMISHTGHILTIGERSPDMDFGIVPIPTYDGTGKPELRHHGWDIGIAATSELKEEAWMFISFMLRKENLVSMSNELLKIPAMYDAEIDYLDAHPVVGDAINYMNEYDMIEELMTMPKSSACWVELTKAGSAVMQGVLTPEEALAQTQAKWDEILGQ